MPRLRKLSAPESAAREQPPIGIRAQIAREFDSYLSGFAVDDYGRADLSAGERRAVVRARLHAAARRRGLRLHFRSGRGPLIFRVSAAPAAIAKPVASPRETPRPMVERPLAERPAYRRQTATERYRDLLPRWMRAEHPKGRRGGGGRRSG